MSYAKNPGELSAEQAGALAGNALLSWAPGSRLLRGSSLSVEAGMGTRLLARDAVEAFGPRQDRLAEQSTPGLRMYAVPEGGEFVPARAFDPSGAPLPYGFKDFREYGAFVDVLKAGLPENTSIVFKGSSVSGRSSPYSKMPGAPFDYGRLSDYDIALVNDDLYLKSLDFGRSAGFNVKTMPDRIGPLSAEQASLLGLREMQKILSQQSGRPVEFMFYDNISDALKGPSHIVKLGI